METYSAIKLLHVTCAFISVSGFFYRWFLIQQRSKLMDQTMYKVLPHVIDTVLLASALWLIINGPFDLASEHWLLAKMILLIVYILFGMRAFRKSLDMDVRRKAFNVAAICVSLILLLALEHLFRVNHGNILNNGATNSGKDVREFDHDREER